jgi:hypothetical protein
MSSPILTQRPVTITYPDFPPTTGQIRVQEYSDSDRMKNAIKIGLMCWGGAVFAVFIPMLHFVLVPLLLLMGPILGLVKYNQKAQVLAGQGTCPACQAPLKIVKGTLNWPLEETCDQCWRKSKIEAAI